MSEGRNAPDLKLLDDKYERLGELRASDDTRMHLAKRRSDGADVLITVVHAASGGEHNALAHFASDTQMLARITHPNVPRVLEGRWLGKDVFAVVSERVHGTSLAELMSSGERFPYPRVATVLQRVTGVLDWARGQGVVHRGVTEDTLAFEHGTHRPVMSLALTPVPLEGVPDASADARMIGRLAWSMLTGKVLVGDASEKALIALRPDLSQRVAGDTVAMIRSKRGVEPPDVQNFLAVIANGDALKAAEVDIARIQAELFEERRIERERLAAERLAEREKFAAEQRVYVAKAAEIERRLADDRAAFERRKAEEEEQLAATERQLAAERLQFDQERLELEERSAELAAARADVERLKADEERRIATAVSTAVAAAIAAIPTAPTEIDDSLADLAIEAGLSKGEEFLVNDKTWDAEAPPAGEVVARRRRWLMPTIAAGVLVVLIAIAVIVNRGGAIPGVVSVGKETVVPTPSSNDAGRVPRGGFMSQSAGGNVAQPVGAPLATHDTTNANARQDSLALSVMPISALDSAERQDSIARHERAILRERARRARERDSIAAARDTLRIRDSIARIRPDTNEP
jgi:hypothetical protein